MRFCSLVGFELVRVSHVFYFWDFVPWNLESGVAPLRAYRKIIEFRLLFHSIRSPKVPQNPIQPQPYPKSVLVSGWNFWLNFGVALGNQLPERILQSARAELKNTGCATRGELYTVGSLFCCLSRDFLTVCSKPKTLSLSLNFIFFPNFSTSNPRFYSLSHLNILT